MGRLEHVVNALFTGVSIITYDDSPTHNGMARHFELISRRSHVLRRGSGGAEGRHLDDALKNFIVDAIRSEVSPRYVSDDVIGAPEVAKTGTGKLREVPVKRLFHGAEPLALYRVTAEDPDVLDWCVRQAAAFQQAPG